MPLQNLLMGALGIGEVITLVIIVSIVAGILELAKRYP